MIKNNQNSIVLRFWYAVLAIVFVAAIVLLILLHESQQTEITVRDRIEYYHMKSFDHAQRLREDARDLNRQLQQGGAIELVAETGPANVRMLNIGLDGALYSMRSHLAQLTGLNEEYGGPPYDSSLQRVVEKFNEIGELSRGSAPTGEATIEIAAFVLAVQQYERLHANAADFALGQLSAEDTSVLPFFQVFVAVILVTVTLVWFLSSLLRKSLDKQAQFAEEIAASNERMYHMQKMEAMGQLVGGVAHDFNNLLQAIIGNVYLLQAEAPGNERIRSGLAEINSAAELGAKLTRQLLAFSRRQKVRPRLLDLNEIIREMHPMLVRLATEDTGIDMDVDDGLCRVEVDPGQLSQVIMNLFVNAVDAMPQGGNLVIRTENVRINPEYSMRHRIPEGEYARLTFQDNGIGMDKATRDRIFDPFFTTKKEGHGTGMGLATVHGIVTGANGHIMVHSRTGDGSRFEIYLPRSNGNTEASAIETKHETSEPGSETILVLEDEEQIRNYLERGLSKLGYRVLTAADGLAGLEICSNEQGEIDVIVSDVVMPGMSGPEFMVQAQRFCPDAIGIYMSGYTETIILNRGIDGSEIPIIMKPFRLHELVQLIRESLADTNDPPSAVAFR